MNWPKAKTLLVIAFALMDIFLGYQVWARAQQQYAGQYVTTTGYQTREALEQLARANVAVAVDIPRKAEPMEWLVVTRPNLNKETLEAHFFPAGTPVMRRVQTDHGTRIYFLGMKSELSVFEDGSLAFKRYGINPSPGPAQVDAAKAREAASAFIKEYGGFPGGATGERIDYDRLTGTYHVSYNESYQGRAHYGAKLTALVTGDGRAFAVEEVWPKPLGFEGPKKALLPATDALLRLAGALPPHRTQRVQVVEIGLGYYSKSYDSDRWLEPPVWRIRLDDGSVYHVNAYTGQLEP